MSVLRQDPTTGGWVIVAPGRRDRPHAESHKASAKHARACPLCPGHESETPAELWRAPAGPGAPWAVRVVPNKFAVLSPSKGEVEAEAREQAGIFREQEGVGHHELIVDSPHHNRRMGDMSTSEIADVLDAYHARYTELRRDPRVAYVIVFKNSGGRAGASLDHPHSQLVATPMAPLGLERRYARACAHYDETGRCLYCDLLDVERQTGRRLVQESEEFVAFCPFASGVPYETWIAPRRHQPSFGATTRSERIELAAVLRSTLGALGRGGT